MNSVSAEYMAEAGEVELTIAEPNEQELKQFNPMNNSALNIEKTKMLGYENCFGVKEACEHTVEILRSLLETKDKT